MEDNKDLEATKEFTNEEVAEIQEATEKIITGVEEEDDLINLNVGSGSINTKSVFGGYSTTLTVEVIE